MKKLLSIVTAAALTSSILYADGSTTLSIGGTYSEGDYGTQDTTTTYYVPVVAYYQDGMFSASVTVPYMRIESEGSVTMTSGGPVPIFNTGKKTTTSTSTTTDGLGDITLNIGYTFTPANDLFLKTSALMKVATADETKGLGTGKHDYSAQVDLYKTMNNAYIYITAGYTVTGDTNTEDYNDIWYGSAALGFNINDSFSCGMNYTHRQALNDTIDDTQSISPYFSYKLDKSYKIDFNYAYGFTDATADNSFTVTLSQTF